MQQLLLQPVSSAAAAAAPHRATPRRTAPRTRAASIPVIGFNAVLMSEHFGAFLAFVVLHGAMLVRAAYTTLPRRTFWAALAWLGAAAGAVAAVGVARLAAYVLSSPTYGWTGACARGRAGLCVCRRAWWRGAACAGLTPAGAALGGAVGVAPCPIISAA